MFWRQLMHSLTMVVVVAVEFVASSSSSSVCSKLQLVKAFCGHSRPEAFQERLFNPSDVENADYLLRNTETHTRIVLPGIAKTSSDNTPWFHLTKWAFLHHPMDVVPLLIFVKKQNLMLTRSFIQSKLFQSQAAPLIYFLRSFAAPNFKFSTHN